MKKVLFYLCLTLEIVFFIWFCIPLRTRVLNIGNITGILIFGTLIPCTVFSGNLFKVIKSAWKDKIGRVCTVILTAIVCAVLILASLLTCLMISANVKPAKENSTVVILGCGVRGERPTLMLTERMDAAYDYLTRNPDSVCILSGGMGKGEDISEAECMFRYLTAKGISPDRLYKEDRSTSTRENLKFSLDIIKSNDLNENVVIVTNEFHEYRAGRAADKLNISHTSCPAKTAWWLFPTYYVRELYGILYEFVF